ncbi:MAG: sulfite dehydrogenase [Gemmatimonadaceae bacterium]|nr:sulfite dehydrogenase [Gemmatimonadaceae bacterium]
MTSRRTLLKGAAGAAAGLVAARLAEALPTAPQDSAAVTRPLVPEDPTAVTGAPTSAVGSRSPFVEVARTPTGLTEGTSKTPLERLSGTITPSDLAFERHHAGIPAIDPARHRLVVHGRVARPTEFTLDDLQRFPHVVRPHFIECAGNGRAAFRDPKPTMTPQQIDGQLLNCEWTGVRLRDVLAEVGMDPAASWMLAEGGDACRLARSVPVWKALDDALLVWGQNGEPLRPEAGYPLRLLVPGWEGNINVKWLRRLELGSAPWMTRWETSKYTDPVLGDVARQFTFEQDVKSIITAPSHPATLSPGPLTISGLAWSGRGTITRVEVSTDGGRSWREAELVGREHPKAVARFLLPWRWDGASTVLVSRAHDSSGDTQPDRRALRAARGAGTDYHFNELRAWRIAASGAVTFANAELWS